MERDGRGGYGEIAGYASTFDPRPGSGCEPGLRRAIELARGHGGFNSAMVVCDP